nr:MAG TPA: hypothetical protein [Caudoviricetes sp.]
MIPHITDGFLPFGRHIICYLLEHIPCYHPLQEARPRSRQSSPLLS